jgi:hypothetical protein
MARLGELLVAAGILTAEQIDQALRAQVIWGGRLGTNLIELGCLDLDELSSALGRQHKLPAALARHFERADAELQQRLSPDLAERFSCVPIARRNDNVVIAAIDPLDDRAKALVASELAIHPQRLVVSIAAELRIRYHLERVYKIPRPTRFLRSRGKTVPAFPFADSPPDSEPELVVPQVDDDLAIPVAHLGGETTPVLRDTEEISRPDTDEIPRPDTDEIPRADTDEIPRADTEDETASLDDLTAHLVAEEPAIPRAITPEQSGRERRRYVRTLADEPSTDSERAALGRIQIRRVARREVTDQPAESFAEATRAIRRSHSRDKVADMVIDAIERFAPACDAALLMVVRGEVAIGWRGFSRAGSSPPELAVPMQEGLVPAAIARNACLRRDAEDLDALDQLLFRALGGSDGDLVIVPVPIAGQVMCLIALATASDAAVTEVETVAVAAGAAFARLMRAAGR